MIMKPDAGHAFPLLSEYVLCWAIDLFRISLFTHFQGFEDSKPNLLSVTTSHLHNAFSCVYITNQATYPICSAHKASLGGPAEHLSPLTKEMPGKSRVSAIWPPATMVTLATDVGLTRPGTRLSLSAAQLQCGDPSRYRRDIVSTGRAESDDNLSVTKS